MCDGLGLFDQCTATLFEYGFCNLAPQLAGPFQRVVLGFQVCAGPALDHFGAIYGTDQPVKA